MAAQEIFRLFKQVCQQLQEKDALLNDARETINLLESELAHLREISDIACQRVNLESRATQNTGAHVKRNEQSEWIEDVWLSSPATANLLADAQVAWIQNPVNPQAALALTSIILKRRDLNLHEIILCTLFESAVLLSIGKLDDSCARANAALQLCKNIWDLKDLESIAYYLRGRYLLERENYRLAFRDFSFAIFADGYRESARIFRDRAERGMVREEASGAPLFRN